MNPLHSMAKAVGQFFAPRPSAAPQGPLQVLNMTRGTILATRLEAARTSATRRKGLLGRDSLLSGEGLWIAPCESVHTFFMRFAIDLVYLDRKQQVRKVRSEVGPWKMSACWSAHSVLELPAGTIVSTRTERGDSVEFAPATTGAESGL
ncbi:MAG: DUF192 domain-containing protein [Terracidiphilus sp.]|jgi:uncharacterized membrane protein (UPF0127 family)